MNSILPKDLYKKIAAGASVVLLDVRTPAEYAALHAATAVLTPLEALNPQKLASDLERVPGEVFVICHSGTRAQKAIDKLAAAGLAQCVLVEGGIAEWTKAGLPDERQPARTISLERQVRITAGGLVLLGTAMGAWAHPGFLLLAAFVGAGLMFAGITDYCGMGMLLARMPWNQAHGKQTQASCACAKQGIL
jgi:rhodanese-related sulfurtransferase